ncbi:hypothetical protein OROHE_022610 [Orobanche hederae]
MELFMEKLGRSGFELFSESKIKLFVFLLIIVGGHVLTFKFTGGIEEGGGSDAPSIYVAHESGYSRMGSVNWTCSPRMRGVLNMIDEDDDDTLHKASLRKDTRTEAVKFEDLTGISLKFWTVISLKFWTRENVQRFFSGDFTSVDGFPEFRVFELPRWYIDREQEVIYFAYPGTMSHLKHCLELEFGGRPCAWHEGMAIAMSITVQLRENAGTHTDFVLFDIDLLNLYMDYLTDELVYERHLMNDGIGTANGMDIHGGLLADCMATCLKEYIGSRDDTVALMVHHVDAWIPDTTFLCSKVYPSLEMVEYSDQPQELIEIRGSHMVGSCLVPRGGLCYTQRRLQEMSRYK